MQLIGLTGGVGMGKSTAAELLSRRNLPIIDTDLIARQAVAPDQTALAEIQRQFGPQLIGADGRLDRNATAQLVFNDAAARKALEAILLPRIRAAWLAETEKWRAQDHAFGVVVIPLLFEANAAGYFDYIICVACSTKTQRQRLVARHWPDAHIDLRNAAQWPIGQKIAKSDFVVWTEGSLAVHQAQLDKIFARIGG